MGCALEIRCVITLANAIQRLVALIMTDMKSLGFRYTQSIIEHNQLNTLMLKIRIFHHSRSTQPTNTREDYRTPNSFGRS